MNERVVNYQSEYYSENFEKYVAAVEMAKLASGGSGDLNEFDHVAKDLHRPGFDEELESIESWKAKVFRATWEEEIIKMTMDRYDPSPALP